MADLKLVDYDMDLTNGELSFVTGQEAIAQDITMSLRTWLGESVYAVNAGVPWLQVIFRGKNPNLDSINFILSQNALGRPGVLAVQLQLDLDSATRKLSITGNAQSIEGNVDFSVIIEATP